jgi:capsular exopolysaccharide synthesis family protein
MDMIEKRYEQQLPQDITYIETPVAEAHTSVSLITPILRRWRVVLITFLSICAVGVPAIWLFGKSVYESAAAIRVAPIIPSILFADKDSEGVIPMYDNFKNTQANLITSEQVFQRVADDLADKNLTFFEKPNNIEIGLKDKPTGKQNPALIAAIKEMVIGGDLRVTPERKTELIKISMKSTNPKETAQIVDAFVRAYMGIMVDEETKGGDQSLTILENEARALTNKLEKQQQVINEMAQEYGTSALDEYHQMMFHRVATLQTELTKAETRRITLQAQVELLQETENQGVDTEKLIKIRQDFLNADLMLQSLTANVVQMEQALMIAKQTLAPTNPELKQKADLLDMLKQRLDQRRQEVNKNFDEMIARELANNDKKQLESARAELKQTETYEKYLRELLAKEDGETIELGRKQLAIKDSERQLKLTEELYDKVRRRIQELEMERKRPARISVAYYANTLPVQSKRIKYTIALIFGSFSCGALLAFLRARADHSLYTPVDISKRIGVRVIGTTTSINHPDILKLPNQIADDYQTIRANLELLNGGNIPKKLVITSPAVREGKTTFAINFSTSLARSGKKVLLIDGDLRKSDMRELLNLPKGSRGLQELLFGGSFEDVVCSVPLAGFDVLTADSGNTSGALELLSRPCVSECINVISAKYDHIIIDSPPVLAFPDALLWARIADGVILMSFAGRTEERDIKETLDRLAQINIKVLGVVLNNVNVNYSYNRYGYSYYTGRATGGTGHRRKSHRAVLLLTTKEQNKAPDDSKS